MYILIIQVNEKFLELKKGHIGIVEKAQETSSDSDMHNTVLVPLLYFMNSGCVLECRETHIMGNNLIPISVPIHFVDGSYMYYIGVFSSGV